MDFVNRWSEWTEIPASRFIGWLGISTSKFYNWRSRYGKVNEHHGWIPRHFWLEDWEKQAILDFYGKYPEEGYRRLAFMMLDADIVAVSPTSPRVRTSTGRWTFPTSISAGRSTTCAASWTAIAASLSTGTSASP